MNDVYAKNYIGPGMIRAVRVRITQPIFEDDFVERGMVAWITDVTWEDDCYRIWMDFAEFEDENRKYFKATYYPNIHTQELTGELMDTDRNRYTALEAGCYQPKYDVYLSIPGLPERDDEAFSEEIWSYVTVNVFN
jgi:hypothetical protein